MIHTLQLQDFVIVESLQLQLESGLTIITGETGAGKSIIVDALGLLLGGRADSGFVRQGCEQTVLSASFTVTPAVTAWLETQKIPSEQCCIRRVINASGRSRAWINDQNATIQKLTELGDLLVDIHSQHAHQSLLHADTQRQLLDGMLSPNDLLNQVQNHYANWKQLSDELLAIGGDSDDRAAQLALLTYQVEELQKLDVENLQLDALNEEHRRLAHASQLLDTAQQVLNSLESSEPGAGSALVLLGQASRQLEAAQNHDKALEPVTEMLLSAHIQAQEANNELRHYIDHLEINPQRLDELDQRISLLQDVARKHQIAVDTLPEHLQILEDRLHALENYEQRAAELEQAQQQALDLYRQSAQQLALQRQQMAAELELAITQNMQPLGLPNGQLKIKLNFNETAQPTLQGNDKISFLVSTNPGHPPKPLNKAASGGELSRISLAIQVVTAQSGEVDTLVFDEVDVGIGGGVAEIVGRKLAELGQHRQVLCITHLPQVAACGHHHLQVQKNSAENQTHTQICTLDVDARIEEIARMLGGVEITRHTLAHAREMLGIH